MAESSCPSSSSTDEDYFSSYDGTRVHMKMIKDNVRTESYRRAIMNNPHLIKDKVVMDVGCGVGILSLFAAKAGARRVIAIEASEAADLAQQVVSDNLFDHVITVVKAKLEDLIELPHGILEVDVIISEYMGYCLFQERMMDSVILARDKWLKKGGAIFPDFCSLSIVAITDAPRKAAIVDYWNDYQVKGPPQSLRVQDGSKRSCVTVMPKLRFNMNVMRKIALTKVKVCLLKKEQILSNTPCLLFDLDMNHVTLQEIEEMVAPFELTINYPRPMHALATFFNVAFQKAHVPIQFSTAPWEPDTHWGQSVFFLDKAPRMNAGNQIQGIFSIFRSPSQDRDLHFKIKLAYGTNRKGDLVGEINKYQLVDD